jgi:hypothetical protein
MHGDISVQALRLNENGTNIGLEEAKGQTEKEGNMVWSPHKVSGMKSRLNKNPHNKIFS